MVPLLIMISNSWLQFYCLSLFHNGILIGIFHYFFYNIININKYINNNIIIIVIFFVIIIIIIITKFVWYIDFEKKEKNISFCIFLGYQNFLTTNKYNLI